MCVAFRLQVLVRRTSRIRKVNVNFAVYIYSTRAQILRGAHDCSNFLIPDGLSDLIIAPRRYRKLPLWQGHIPIYARAVLRDITALREPVGPLYDKNTHKVARGETQGRPGPKSEK